MYIDFLHKYVYISTYIAFPEGWLRKPIARALSNSFLGIYQLAVEWFRPFRKKELVKERRISLWKQLEGARTVWVDFSFPHCSTAESSTKAGVNTSARLARRQLLAARGRKTRMQQPQAGSDVVGAIMSHTRRDAERVNCQHPRDSAPSHIGQIRIWRRKSRYCDWLFHNASSIIPPLFLSISPAQKPTDSHNHNHR